MSNNVDVVAQYLRLPHRFRIILASHFNLITQQDIMDRDWHIVPINLAHRWLRRARDENILDTSFGKAVQETAYDIDKIQATRVYYLQALDPKISNVIAELYTNEHNRYALTLAAKPPSTIAELITVFNTLEEFNEMRGHIRGKIIDLTDVCRQSIQMRPDDANQTNY